MMGLNPACDWTSSWKVFHGPKVNFWYRYKTTVFGTEVARVILFNMTSDGEKGARAGRISGITRSEVEELKRDILADA